MIKEYAPFLNDDDGKMFFCKHHYPDKFGSCPVCSEEHKNNLKRSVDMKEIEEAARASLEHSIDHCQDGIEKCFERIEKLEGYMQMEDRITASDILFRLSELEKQHKLSPYKCPVCEGAGWRKGLDGEMSWVPCSPCDNKGIVWSE